MLSLLSTNYTNISGLTFKHVKIMNLLTKEISDISKWVETFQRCSKYRFIVAVQQNRSQLIRSYSIIICEVICEKAG